MSLHKLNIFRRKDWLSHYVSREKRRIQKIVRLQYVTYVLKLIWNGKVYPFLTSKWCSFLIFSIFLLYHLFPIDKVVYSFINFNYTLPLEFYLTLWQVHSAIIGIAFVIIVFFFETLSSRIPETYRNLENRFRQEFYKESLILPFLFYNLFSIVYIGIIVSQSSSLFQCVTLLTFSILSICYLFAKSFTFFQTSSLEITRLNIITQEINRSVDNEINRRISTNLLFNAAQKNDHFKYSPYMKTQEIDLIPIDLNVDERKIITDINIGSILSIMAKWNKEFILCKEIGDIISTRNGVVGYVSKESQEDVVESLKKCFESKKYVLYRDLDMAFDDLQTELNKAIDRQNFKELWRICEIYYNIIDTFLKVLYSYGIKYDVKQAREAVSIRDWEPLTRIQLDFFQVIERAFKTQNKEIIRGITDFPNLMLTAAIENFDHLVFRRFKGFFATIYFKSFEEDAMLKSFITDQILSNIQNLVSVVIPFRLENEMKKEKLSEYLSYLIESLSIYESLLKLALDKDNIKDFKDFGYSLDNSLEYFKPKDDRPYIAEIQIRLQNPQLSPDEREEWTQILEAKKQKIEIKNQSESYIQQIWFGLGGWLTELFNNDKIIKVLLKDFFEIVIVHFQDLQSLSSIFLGSTDLSQEFSHEWRWWQLTDEIKRPPFFVEVTQVTNDWLTRFYCLHGSCLTPYKIKSLDLIEPSSKLKNQINSFNQMCGDIKDKIEKWSVVIEEKSAKRSRQKVDNFLKIITHTVEKQQNIEDQWLINQPLSENKIAKFKETVTEAWKKSSAIRSLILKLGRYEDTQMVNEHIQAFGMDKLVSKDIFVEGLYAGSWGGLEIFGDGMGKGESRVILKKIADTVRENCLQISIDNLIQELNNAVDKVKSQGYDSNIIFAGEWDIVRKLGESTDFLARWEENVPGIQVSGFEGYFRNIPVVLNPNWPTNLIWIGDLQKLGIFLQYRVKKESESALDFSINIIDEKMAREYIERNPDILKDEKGKTKSVEEGVIDLQKNVRLLILEKMEYRIDDIKAGITLKI